LRYLLAVLVLVALGVGAWMGLPDGAGARTATLRPPEAEPSAPQESAPFELASPDVERRPAAEPTDPIEVDHGEDVALGGPPDVEGLDPVEAERRMKRWMLSYLEDQYHEGDAPTKRATLSQMYGVSIAAILDASGRYTPMPKVPASVNRDEGEIVFSLNSRMYRFMELEFPEYKQLREFQRANPVDSRDGSTVVPTPPDLAEPIWNTAMRAKLLLED
jgi:hypothetical protein